MQLHWSQIAMYTKCAEQYRRRYILGEKLPPGVALVAGSGFHRGIEATLKHKLQTGELPPVDAAKEAARDAVVRSFSEEVFLNEEEQSEGVGKIKADTIDTAVSCAAVHHAELAPLVTPTAIEREWVLDVPSYSLQLAGTIDCDEGDIIDDWKSAKKMPAATDADDSGQITMYSLAKSILDGNIPRSRLGYVIKTKVPKALFLETTRTKEDFRPLLNVIARVAEAIDRDVFPFASSMSPRPWWCGPRWCGYYKTCDGVCGKRIFRVEKEE